MRFAYILTADRMSAEDLVQEAFVRIYRAGGRVEEAQFRGYARKAILNLSRSFHRRSERERKAIARHRIEDQTPGPEIGNRSDVQHALLSLPVTGRACLALRFYEDMTEQAIADTLDMSLSAVKKQIERSIKALRPLLTERSLP